MTLPDVVWFYHKHPPQPNTSRSPISGPSSKRKHNSQNGTSDSALGWSFLDQQLSLPQFSLDDRRMKVREIAETIGILKQRVGYILHEELDMKKLCTRWVPRLLTADQKRTHVKISEQYLECFNKNETDFMC
jgi:hypothetical protein